MLTRLDGWLTTEITLADAVPIFLLVLLTVLAITMANRSGSKTTPERRPLTPPPLARAELWLERTGIGPFWRIVFWITATAFFGLFLISIVAAYVLVTNVVGSEKPNASLGLGALLVALLGAPFLIWRTLVAQRTLDETKRQTDLQDEAAFNDKINAAAKDLAARRQVTKIVQQDSKDVVLTEWEDDLVTRAAAIDRLEGLAIEAIDREDYAPAQRIARMLSIYVQELSREHPPQQTPAFTKIEQMQDWARALRQVQRPDSQRAVQSLGRINPKNRTKFDRTSISLYECNLQGFTLQYLNFEGVIFSGASLQGAFLYNVNFNGALLEGAKLDASFLKESTFKGAKLRNASAIGAIFMNLQMQSSSLINMNFSHAFLKTTNFEGSDLTSVELSSMSITKDVSWRGAAIGICTPATYEHLRPHWSVLFSSSENPPSGSSLDWRVPDYGDTFLFEFHSAWRVWAMKHYPNVTIAPDYARD